MSEAEYMDPPSEDSTLEITQSSPNTLSVLAQSEHAAMVTTANLPTNRRKLDEFGKKLMAYATHSQAVSLSMFYTLPRAGKQIIGPGVRFAEVVAPCWKNNSTGSRIVGSTNESVTAQGVYIDYEANIRNVKEIPRRITDKDGRKFNADMILTTSKAALSIAYREAILKGGVPMALWSPAYEQAKLTAVGQAISHAARIDAAMDYLMKLGVSEWQIMNSVGVPSPKELEIDHLVTLKALCEEIKKGVRTIEDVFGSPHDKEIEALFVQLKKNETEKRLLRESYMGRAKDLLDYLKERLGKPQGQVVTPAAAKPQTQPATQAQTQSDASTEKKTEQAPEKTQAQPEVQGDAVKRGRGRPSKQEMAAREAAAAQEAAGQQEQNGPQSEVVQVEAEPVVEDKPTPEQPQGSATTGNFNF
jgi:hypothetical protein